MIDWLMTVDVTVLYAFPSFLRQLAVGETSETHAGLRLAYLGGETVLPSDLAAARRLFPKGRVDASASTPARRVSPGLDPPSPGAALPDPVPVGRPALDIGVAIIAQNGTPAAAWRARRDRDSIAITSVLAPGITGRSKRADGPAPPFRTRDRGCIDADGVVYHLGRVDGMVKIRGFRVEIIEVEAAISALEEVAEVAVLATGEDASAVELTAFVVSQDTSIDPMVVRGAVARALPSAMIPAHVVIVDVLPRTLNGKLDRRGLAQLADARSPAITIRAHRRGKGLG